MREGVGERVQVFVLAADLVVASSRSSFGLAEVKRNLIAGAGGLFSIFVSDLCKGCAACVTACGDHQALKMVQETEEVNAEHESGTAFLNLLPDTPQKYLGLYNDSRPQDSKTATLRNMLMVRRNYDALVSGDGACAGCGEKSVLRSVAAVTEAGWVRVRTGSSTARRGAALGSVDSFMLVEGVSAAWAKGIRVNEPAANAAAAKVLRVARRTCMKELR